ncbi:MAG: AAA family ATPase [Lachnospiraceae bacterium]|nr:AAA family ATPase [Lachnospiraceae bacterium]
MRKVLPIGNDNFTEIREKKQYFVDKSLFIKDFIEMEDKVALIARPRRFGKTLNMTMVRDFFDITKDSRELFKGLAMLPISALHQKKQVSCWKNMGWSLMIR